MAGDEYEYEYEYEILALISQSDKPVGSGTLSVALLEEGQKVSEATVGRVLRRLDLKGYTVKVGRNGRLLTVKGNRRLAELRGERERGIIAHELVAAVSSRGQEQLIDVLNARRAIERETARLAALNATEEEIREMRAVMREHEVHAREGVIGVTDDLKFHKLIARASRNKILEATVDLIRKDSQLTPMLEFIRRQMKSRVVSDHRKIVQAIEERAPDRAESAMMDHMDGLIKDVRRYWAEFERVPREA